MSIVYISKSDFIEIIYCKKSVVKFGNGFVKITILSGRRLVVKTKIYYHYQKSLI